MSASDGERATDAQALRYARHIVLPEVGSAGQARLERARVLIVGLGGLGCPAAQLLAGSGIGRLWLNDFDTVDASNLPRQILYTPADVGKPKTEAAAARLLELNPAIVVEQIRDRASAAQLRELLGHIDVVLDGTDNFATRFAVSDACVESRTPLVSGAAIRLEGQIAVFRNDGTGPCYRCVYDEADEWLGDCQGNGVLAPVTATIGAMMALETLKLLLELDDAEPALQLWDARSGAWTRVALRRNPDCVSCGASV
ncbi:MAG TPA: HesA/MoeB/ThiF family protein [Gammaproteobacteria bacterium]|nr:HesA/MoeB/ThiF family protein [Gammaproteobacteria bacterium]